MEGVYHHLCSNGLESSLLYHDQRDFIDGMNDIPICLQRTKLKLLAFCLMSNHFHFVLKGSYEDCAQFFAALKRRLSVRLKERYQDVHTTKRMEAFIGVIDKLEYLRNAVAYTLRNPYAAQMNYPILGYPYSSSSLYFNNDFQRCLYAPAADFSTRELRAMLSIGDGFSNTWMINRESSLIYPGSYVEVEEVEKLFGTAKNLFFEVYKNDDAKFELDQGFYNKVSFSTDEVRSFICELCIEEFHCDDFKFLDITQKLDLGRLLHRRYHVGPKLYARIARLPLSVVQEVMK